MSSTVLSIRGSDNNTWTPITSNRGYFFCLAVRGCTSITNKVITIVKALVEASRFRTTQAAPAGALALGFDLAEMRAVVMALNAGDFYKSMTTHADHRIWQDVYRPRTEAGDVYLKLTVIDEVLIVSFKEL